MDEPHDDAFERACRRLEQLSELKDKQRIDEANFEKLKTILIAEMRRSIAPIQRTIEERPSQPVVAADHPVQFGYLHGEIVRVLNERYRNSPEDARQRIFRAMSDMADSRALFPGDSAELEKLVDGVFAPYEQSTDPKPDDELRILVRTLADLNRISMKVRDNPERSPAAKAITEVTQQSANQVAVEFEAQVPQPGGPKKPLRELWGGIVLKDVEGAFEGGAATVTIAPAVAAVQPFALPVIAAIGVVIGSGVRSAIAYRQD